MGTEAHDLRAMTAGFKYDRHLLSTHNAINGLTLRGGGAPELFLGPNPNAIAVGGGGGVPDQPFLGPNNVVDLPCVPPPPPTSCEDGEMFSDIVLSYISQMLMEEDMDDKLHLYQEPSAIQAAEKPFYDILCQSCSAGGSCNANSCIRNSSGSGGSSVDYSSQSLFDYTNSLGNVDEGSKDHFGMHGSGDAAVNARMMFPALQFIKGAEEARKFLPSEDKLLIDLEANGFSIRPEPEKEGTSIKVKSEQEEREHSINGSRGRKNPHREDSDSEEGRSIKTAAVYFKENVRTEMFDEVLLCNDEKCGENGNIYHEVVRIREAAQKEAIAQSSQNTHPKGSKGHGKKQTKKEVVDFGTLLTQCAQMVADNDWRSANELLKQIRLHSSPFGDGLQRLAHYFADGLEARLASTGSQIYHSFIARKKSTSVVLRAFRLYLSACPFTRISYFCANRTILSAAEKATRLHIVDFGTYYGFQWPCFIQNLSKRADGPPKLRITGIDAPQPGFRPSAHIEETGCRLADYARSFGVPFEFHAIASKWEAVRVEDLNINKDELLIVNCLNRLENVMDETVSVDSPRNMVLNNIRKIDPVIFILGTVNGTYNAPFFVTRFREALFHFSAMFDMLEANVPRGDSQRMLIERELFGRDALNVISCEGSDRVERPETYKKWHVRNLRAGFEQLPLNQDIMKRTRDKVKGSYHKDFIIYEDNQWLLQGWKGRMTHALSIWKPAKIH